MTLEKLATETRLPSQAIRVVKRLRNKIPSYFFDYRAFANDPDTCFKRLEAFCIEHSVNKYEAMLTLVCNLALSAYDKYAKRGLYDIIYFDTFLDISIWCNVCFKRYGVWGLEEYLWLKHHICLNLFRLGRLQFLPERSEKCYTLPNYVVNKDEMLLGVHIPEDGRLDYVECQNSYQKAQAFFSQPQIYFCDSWLLNPKLKQFLSAESNIIKFQKDFVLFDEDLESRQAEERVFFKLCDDPSLYPESTSLQKKMKQYLCAGNKVGTVQGLFCSF